jgi:hypothetical protein
VATAAQIQQLAWFSVGGLVPGGPPQEDETAHLMAAVQAQLPALYSVAASRTRIPGLVLRYLQYELLFLLEGQLRTKRDGNLGPLQQREETLFRHVVEMKKQVLEEIVRLEVRAGKGLAPAVGEITAEALEGGRAAATTVKDVDGIRVAETERTEVTPAPGSSRYSGSPLDRSGNPRPPGW